MKAPQGWIEWMCCVYCYIEIMDAPCGTGPTLFDRPGVVRVFLTGRRRFIYSFLSSKQKDIFLVSILAAWLYWHFGCEFLMPRGRLQERRKCRCAQTHKDGLPCTAKKMASSPSTNYMGPSSVTSKSLVQRMEVKKYYPTGIIHSLCRIISIIIVSRQHWIRIGSETCHLNPRCKHCCITVAVLKYRIKEKRYLATNLMDMCVSLICGTGHYLISCQILYLKVVNDYH